MPPTLEKSQRHAHRPSVVDLIASVSMLDSCFDLVSGAYCHVYCRPSAANRVPNNEKLMEKKGGSAEEKKLMMLWIIVNYCGRLVNILRGWRVCGTMTPKNFEIMDASSSFLCFCGDVSESALRGILTKGAKLPRGLTNKGLRKFLTCKILQEKTYPL